MAIWRIENHKRSSTVCRAMLQGIQAAGDIPSLYIESRWQPNNPFYDAFDAHVFYGLEGKLSRIFGYYADRTDLGRVVYIDLGYWNRRPAYGRFEGSHKISIDARHPSAYYRKPRYNGTRPEDRALRFHQVKNTRGADSHILVAAMSAKGSIAEGIAPYEWELAIIEAIRKVTDRRIVFRPKPSDYGYPEIQGVTMSRNTLIETDLRNCWALVTHHSNAVIDATIAGVPSFCWGGVGVEMSRQDLSLIEHPDPGFPNFAEIRAWLDDIGHAQFTVPEMRLGHAWRHLKKEGLV